MKEVASLRPGRDNERSGVSDSDLQLLAGHGSGIHLVIGRGRSTCNAGVDDRGRDRLPVARQRDRQNAKHLRHDSAMSHFTSSIRSGRKACRITAAAERAARGI